MRVKNGIGDPRVPEILEFVCGWQSGAFLNPVEKGEGEVWRDVAKGSWRRKKEEKEEKGEKGEKERKRKGEKKKGKKSQRKRQKSHLR